MGKRPPSKTSKGEAQKKRTAANKIKRIKKALETAGGNAIAAFQERIKFLEGQL